MKLLKVLCCALMLCTASVYTAIAQTTLPMIVSYDALKAYARDWVGGAEYQVEAPTLVYNRPDYLTAAGVGYGTNNLLKLKDIQLFIRNNPLRFELGDPSESAKFKVRYLSGNWEDLFTGEQTFYLEPCEGCSNKWRVPAYAKEIKLTLAEEIPIPVSQYLTWARIESRNEWGQNESWWANVRDGRLYFPTRFSKGRMGNVILGFNKPIVGGWTNWQEVVDLATGTNKTIVAAEAPLAVAIKDYVTFENTNVVHVQPTGECSPLAELTLATETKVFVYASTATEVAFQFKYRASRTDEWIVMSITPGQWTPVVLSPGTYYFSFDWVEFGQQCPETAKYPPWWYYGGKG
jgi:hypothetical protein